MYLNKLLVLVCVLMTFSVASNEGHQEREEHGEHGEHAEQEKKENKTDEHDEHEESIKLTPKEIKDFDIQISKVKGGVISELLPLNGEVRINENNRAIEMARFGGLVIETNVKQGQYVSKGSVLAVVQNNNNLSTYDIVASQSGVVTKRLINKGAVVSNADVLFEVVNFSTVWVELSVYQKDFSKVKKGQKLRLRDSYGKVDLEAKINFIESSIEESTRTLKVRATVKNRAKVLKPGMFVKGLVFTHSKSVDVLIPQSAVHTYEGKQVVFTVEGDLFEPREIKVGHNNELELEVESGLKSSESYVSKNGFVVKSELGKSEMSDGHNH